MISAESPPAVVDPKRAAESNLGWILGVVTAVHAVAIIVAGLRSYVRIKIIKSLGRDDWTMVAATLCALGGWVLFVYQGSHGLGHHQDTISNHDLMKTTQATFWLSIVNASWGICLLKVSIALNLLRLSSTRWYTWCLWASIALVSAYSFLGMMTFLLHCRPMEAHWDFSIQGKCYPIPLFITFAILNTSLNIFTDVLFATAPIPVIWSLQMKKRTRLYLIGVLSLGYLAVAMGIMKAIYQLTFATQPDQTYHSWITFWAAVQLNVGIIAASAPSLKPLVSKVLKLTSYSTSHYGTRSHGSGALRTIGGGSHMRSRHRDEYGLEELDSNDGQNSDELQFNRKGHTSATATFYTPHVVDGDRSGSEDMIVSDRPRPRDKFAIVKTTEVTIS